MKQALVRRVHISIFSTKEMTSRKKIDCSAYNEITYNNCMTSTITIQALYEMDISIHEFESRCYQGKQNDRSTSHEYIHQKNNKSMISCKLREMT